MFNEDQHYCTDILNDIYLSQYLMHKFYQQTLVYYCLANKQYVFRTGILAQRLAEFVTWPVQSGAVLTSLPVQKSVLLS